MLKSLSRDCSMIVAALTETRMTLLRCDTPGCGQVLAEVSERGAVHPVIIGAFCDKDGRLVVRCPGCKQEKALPIRRRG